MDFDTNLLSSHDGAAAFSLLNNNNHDDDSNKQKCYGFGLLKQDRAINEEDLREFKMAKTSSCGEGMARYPLQRSNGCGFSEGQQQMLSFSSPYTQTGKLPYYQYAANAFGRNAGINGGGMQGVRGPFTPSQWMELEHQALIYKYITANIPIPSYLLNPIRKAFDSAGFSVLRSNPLGWGGFQLGFSNTDPEPGRCRRTDGKKWRCSRDAVVDQKYCERHMNRGRHRSRKPVEAQPTKPTSNNPISATPPISRGVLGKQKADGAAKEPEFPPHKQLNSPFQEFGLVCSDSLLNPLNRSSSLIASTNYNNDRDKSQNALRQFIDEWPKQLSISIPTPTLDKPAISPPRELEMGLGVGNRNPNPISWEPTSIGGPLGEVLHNSIGDCSNPKQLNLIERWDNSPRLVSSPTGVLSRGAFVSLSNSSAASSPRAESHCNGMMNPGLMNPSLPAL